MNLPALDHEMLQEILDVMITLSNNISMIVATHEMGFAKQVADRIIFMDVGEIVEEGTPEHFINSINGKTKLFLSKMLS